MDEGSRRVFILVMKKSIKSDFSTITCISEIFIMRHGGFAMSIIYLKNKRNDITYVYESKGHWDKEKQQSRSKRICIGKLDKNGEVISSKRLPTLKAMSKNLPQFLLQKSNVISMVLFTCSMQLAKKLDIVNELKTCFSQDYKQILSIAANQSCVAVW